MPRKTEEQKDKKNAGISASNKKNSRVSKKDTESKEVTKKTKKTSSTKKETTSKTSSKTSTSKAPKKATSKTTKKTTTNKSSVSTKNKTSTRIRKTIKKEPEINIVEYYDLPYRYNQTIVKVLAQTPKTLFVYWDISDVDRENYKKQYGENFFETTKPVLIVHNDKLNYSFEIDINDFANSWYLHVNDSKSDYRIELGRRPISYNEKIDTDYIYVTTSNRIESPNDHILFERNNHVIQLKNVKTNQVIEKSIANLSFAKSMKKLYNIYDLYKEIYKNENVEEIYDLSNPSSGNPSSHTSSKFMY